MPVRSAGVPLGCQAASSPAVRIDVADAVAATLSGHCPVALPDCQVGQAVRQAATPAATGQVPPFRSRRGAGATLSGATTQNCAAPAGMLIIEATYSCRIG